MTHEVFYDKYSGKEIHYVLFPEDMVYPPAIEIQKVFKAGIEIEYTDEQEEEWIDEILLKIQGGN